MEALFRKVGIYSHVGQLYEPVDADTLLYYREASDGQILEEGITEAGAMSSFIAAGTAHANHGINTIPFYIFYSMFGLQRVGDLIWAAGDMRTRGFLVGGTSGRTTLAGEGLQHQDGNSHLLALPVPNLLAYDPAFGFELAVIIREGIRRMYVEQESIFYYITVTNENYPQPPMPEGVEDGILSGLYRYRRSERGDARVHLFGSGAILNEALAAASWLEDEHGVPTDVWSATSWKQLYRDVIQTDRWNRLHPEATRRESFLERSLNGTDGAFVVATDYVASLPATVAHRFPRQPVLLGTDGFGRSDTREALRSFFEIDRRHIAAAALGDLERRGELESGTAARAIADLGIETETPHPITR
jgi:pyruvate dehydrogenase E1 component